MPDSDSDSDSPAPSSDHDLQPFFVLRKAGVEKPTFEEQSPRKGRRKVAEGKVEELDDGKVEELRSRAFKETWGKIESTIQDVLRHSNLGLFDEVRKWILEAFAEMQSVRGAHTKSDIIQPYPLITNVICNQIPTAMILTRNVEFVDDLLTFRELGVYLKTNACHVANLSSLNFTAKQGVGGCIRGLLRQFLVVRSDAIDLSTLCSWYVEPENYNKPLVVIIDDTEQCDGIVLSEFILMLSEWVIKIPVILVLGIATTVNSLRSLLPSDALKHLQPCKFSSEPPEERMNSIIEAVLIKRCSSFTVSHKVALFLRNYFLRHDGTISSFVKALKIACTKHFFMEPLSFLGRELDKDSEESYKSLPSKLLDHAFSLPSCESNSITKGSEVNLLQGMVDLKKLQRCASATLMCVIEVGKLSKAQLLDIFCEAYDPVSYQNRASGLGTKSSTTTTSPRGLVKAGCITRVIHKIRDLPVASLTHILKLWAEHTQDFSEVHDKIKDLQSLLQVIDGDTRVRQFPQSNHRNMSRFFSTLEKETMKVNEKALLLMNSMVRDYLKPMECIPFHEIICFKHVDILKKALIGDPRRNVQVDLLQSNSYIQCCCCQKDKSTLTPSMHDTSILYNLAQEHGDVINLHDWYQSYKAILASSNAKTKRKPHHSPASKRARSAVKSSDASQNTTEALIQARFCRAVTELQITGILRMPSKRRPDFVQRVAFGI